MVSMKDHQATSCSVEDWNVRRQREVKVICTVDDILQTESEVITVEAVSGAVIRKFEVYSQTNNEIRNNGLDIMGKSGSCSGFIVYPEVFDAAGISKGIHFWSILAVKTNPCYHNPGVLTEKVWMDKLDKSVSNWPSSSVHKAYFTGHSNPQWNSGEILTVVLDCDNCKVEYFKNEEKMAQRDVIEKGKSWFFAMTVCAVSTNHYRVVETPEVVLRHYK